MIDETWALSIADIKRREQQGILPFSLPYYWGTAGLLYIAWVICGFLGSLFGNMIGDVERFGFAMAFPLYFWF